MSDAPATRLSLLVRLRDAINDQTGFLPIATTGVVQRATATAGRASTLRTSSPT